MSNAVSFSLAPQTGVVAVTHLVLPGSPVSGGPVAYEVIARTTDRFRCTTSRWWTSWLLDQFVYASATGTAGFGILTPVGGADHDGGDDAAAGRTASIYVTGTVAQCFTGMISST